MGRSRTLTRIVLVSTLAVLGAGAVPGRVGAVAATPPHIVAKPNNVMVNTTISLTGTGFPARTRLAIKECSNTNWVVVAQRPCDTANAISVATDVHGRFAHSFKVQLCPRTKVGPGPVTRETCYIGNPQPRGVDTITLVGAAKVIVTYP